MTTTTKLLTADEALAAMDAIEAAGPPVIGGVVVEKLPDGYYWLTWSTEKFDKTRRVHPWNFETELAEAQAEAV